MQLQTSDGGVQGVELSTFLPDSHHSVRARHSQLGLKMSVEVVAALHLTDAPGQSMMEWFGHCSNGPVQQGGGRRGGISPFPIIFFHYSPG